MPKPQLGSASTPTIEQDSEHNSDKTGTSKQTNRKIPAPADSTAINISKNKNNWQGKNQQPVRVSPFGTAKLPIPREHLRELDDQFGSFATTKNKISPTSKQTPSTSLQSQTKLDTRARLSAAGTLKKQEKISTDGSKLQKNLTEVKSPSPSTKVASDEQPKSNEETAQREPKKTQSEATKIPAPLNSAATKSNSVPSTSTETAGMKVENTDLRPVTSPTPETTSTPDIKETTGTTETISLPQMAQEEVIQSEKTRSDFWAKLPHSRQALVYEVIIALGLLALLLISVWYRIEKEHNKNNPTK